MKEIVFKIGDLYRLRIRDQADSYGDRGPDKYLYARVTHFDESAKIVTITCTNNKEHYFDCLGKMYSKNTKTGEFFKTFFLQVNVYLDEKIEREVLTIYFNSKLEKIENTFQKAKEVFDQEREILIEELNILSISLGHKSFM